MKRLYFYKINENYVRYINQFDSKVSKSYDEKSRRPFIGIVLKVGESLYFAPFTSPKKKHVKMKNTVDFFKIDDGKLGAINFNNMIPIPLEQCTKIDVENEKNIAYRDLLYKQINWCNSNPNNSIILNRAKVLYDKVTNKRLPQRILDRCCNFKLLEEKAIEYEKYLNISNNENSEEDENEDELEI